VLHGSAVLFRKSLAPDPALISGTYSGATVPMAVGERVIEKLTSEGFFGENGREKKLEILTREHLDRLAERHPGVISHIDGIGAMLAFRIGDGLLKTAREFIQRSFDAGLVLYYGGHDPACIRLFLPAGSLTDEELREAFDIIDRCL
jgi:4-aminobutyrate aminotransferase-like enzyme